MRGGSNRFDVVVVGAGIVGLATTQNGLFVAVTESGDLWEFRHSTNREFGNVARLGRLGDQ